MFYETNPAKCFSCLSLSLPLAEELANRLANERKLLSSYAIFLLNWQFYSIALQRVLGLMHIIQKLLVSFLMILAAS